MCERVVGHCEREIMCMFRTEWQKVCVCSCWNKRYVQVVVFLGGKERVCLVCGLQRRRRRLEWVEVGLKEKWVDWKLNRNWLGYEFMWNRFGDGFPINLRQTNTFLKILFRSVLEELLSMFLWNGYTDGADRFHVVLCFAVHTHLALHLGY